MPNGMSLCMIHHAAYDRDILGISPDLVVHLNHAVLEEVDGPMARHGLQDFHGQPLRVVPSKRAYRPDPDRLADRYDRFTTAG